MQKLISKLKSEWEKSLFWAMLLVFLVVFAMRIAPFGDEGGSTVDRKSVDQVKPFLSDRAMAFLGVRPPVKIGPLHAFSFSQRVTRVEKEWPWKKHGAKVKPSVKPKAARPTTAKPKGPKPVAAKPKGPSAPKPVGKKLVAKKPAPPKVKSRPKASRIVEFKGIYISTTGKELAYVRVKDPLAKKKPARSGFWTAGEKVGGVKIGSFDDAQLNVVNPHGVEQAIPKGKQKKIIIE